MRSGRMKPLVFAALIGFAVVGCGAIGNYSHDALNDNREADRANNQQLLLNILRASFRRPEQLTSLRQNTVTSTLQGQVSLTAPLRELGGSTALTLSPQGTISRQPQVVNDILDTQEFYNGFLEPLPFKTFDLYFNQRYPPALLYHLLVSEITLSQGDHTFVAVNAIGDPALNENFPANYAAFRRLVESFFDAGLVTEPISETADIGPSLSPAEVKQRLADIVKASEDGIKLAKAKTGYQLQKTATAYRFCLQSSAGSGAGGEVPKTDANAARTKLIRAAIGLRCGASQEQRRQMEQAGGQSAQPGSSPSLKALSLGAPSALGYCGSVQSDAALTGDLKAYLKRYCRFADNIKALSGLSGKGEIAISMSTRSTEGVLFYLGEVARWQRASPRREILIALGDQASANHEPLCGEAWTGHAADRYACQPLLIVNAGGENRPAFVSVDYEGTTYSVPAKRQEAGLSSQAFEIFHQLFALNKSGKELPATTVLTVTGLP